MHQIRITNKLFKKVQRRARVAGFESVDEYLADILQHDVDDNSSLDHLFTPERLAHIDRAATEIKAGRFYTPEQVDSHLAEARASWLREKPH